MVLRTLLTRPITPILGLCIVLLGMGVISPSRSSQTPIRAYTTATSPVHTMPITQAAPVTAPTVAQTTSTSSAILKHYSVPSGLRGDEGGDSGERGD